MSASTEAAQLVNGQRQEDYGHPFEDFNRIAGMLSALGFRFHGSNKSVRNIDARDFPIIMNCVKLSREVHRHKVDNLIDIHGYINCLEMVLDQPIQELPEIDPAELARHKSHPEDVLAGELIKRKIITLEDWQEAKLASSVAPQSEPIQYLIRVKKLSISQLSSLLHSAPNTVVVGSESSLLDHPPDCSTS